jgi:aryl-alcohol dehydrogenase-like predicted oxidoreductase
MSPSDAPQPQVPTPEQLKAALKAFRKRLKLTRLDDQSRIGAGPMSSGRESGIVGIVPPEQFPQAVWDELVRQGKLRKWGAQQYGPVEP